MSTTHFTPVAKAIESRHLTMALFGDTDTRRTSFAVGTAPEPIYYFYHRGEQWEKGVSRFKDRDIRCFPFGGTIPLDGDIFARIDWAESERGRFSEAFVEAHEHFKKEPGGTVVIDLAKDLRDLLVYSHFGDYKPDELFKAMEEAGQKPNKHMGNNWGPIEAAWSSWIQYGKSLDVCNTIFIERSGDEYVSNKPTGKKILKCAKGIDFASRCVIKLERRDGVVIDPTDPTKVIQQSKFTGTIIKPFIPPNGCAPIPDPTFNLIKGMVL